jgi:FkbM family methyltransferase
MNETYTGHQFQTFGQISYSQWGQDLLILTLFKDIGIENPSYIDCGAYSPLIISNTALMYSRGSRGINIEPNPYLFFHFMEQRYEDVNLNIAVFPAYTNFELEYYIIDHESPCNSLSLQELSDNNLKATETIKVKSMTLNDIIDKYSNGIFPDFLNIDIEGLDYEVLKHTDFVKSRPKIIHAECRDEKATIKMMRDKDYKDLIRIAGNTIFMDKAYCK